MAKSAKQRGDGPSFPHWTPAAAWAATLAALAVTLAIWVPSLVERARGAPLPGPMRVTLEGLPAWLPADERTAIERGILKSVSASPFDREGLAAARQVAAQSGWYVDVAQVRRADVDQVVVDGTWCVPFALVCDAAGEHLIDTRGRLLPRNYPAGKGPRLLRLSGVTHPMPAAIGGTWPGDEVSAALAMATLFADRPWRAQVASIDLSGWARDGVLRMTTDRGCSITWGRAPGKESATEVPASQKLGMLQLAFDRTGRIDAGAPNALDLRGDMSVAR